MKIFNIKYRSRLLKNFACLFTALFFAFYIFEFSLPHDFHCSEKTNLSSFRSSINNSEITHQTASAKESENDNHDSENHNDNDCPVCNLSYFNGLYYTEPLICQTVLIETNEKPVNNIKTGFSSFTFLKFFLRSPPSFTA